GFLPPISSKRKFLGLSSSTKSSNEKLANRHPKDLGGLFVKSRKIREETSGEKSVHRERNCLILNSGVFGSVLRGAKQGSGRALLKTRGISVDSSFKKKAQRSFRRVDLGVDLRLEENKHDGAVKEETSRNRVKIGQ
ncbi:hypothetical protein U1Q18_031862, partial [Sarracenia purpurea var. burkii]